MKKKTGDISLENAEKNAQKPGQKEIESFVFPEKEGAKYAKSGESHIAYTYGQATIIRSLANTKEPFTAFYRQNTNISFKN